MKATLLILLLSLLLAASCSEKGHETPVKGSNAIQGTWRLLSGTLIEKGDTTVTDYTRNLSFIKIINETHFAFLQHDLRKGKDSAASFSAGCGRYTLKDGVYTEHLEYCSARAWEGNSFTFSITLNGDTLVQQGTEKVDSAGINRMNIERYVRMQE